MYHDHFGLDRAPFRITPDTELFYPGGGRGEVLEALVYAVTSGEGIVKVTGEVGTGKTMLCRMLEVRLPKTVEVVYIANPSLSPEDILHAIGLEMNLPVEASAGRLQVMHALQQRLLEMHAQNRRVVVFVEEAQGMPTATLEEIRLLSNLETQRDKLLQIVLFGQPELDEALDRPNIRQLRERITHSFRLEPLSRDEVREYVRFRMRAVGYRGPDVFKEGAYRALARASEGLVRRINILADKALLAAFADDIHNVTPRHMRVAIEDGSFGRRPATRAWWLGGVAALLLAVVGTLFALDHLPWQQWLQRYAIDAGNIVQRPQDTGSTPVPASAVAVAAMTAGETTPAATGPSTASGGAGVVPGGTTVGAVAEPVAVTAAEDGPAAGLAGAVVAVAAAVDSEVDSMPAASPAASSAAESEEGPASQAAARSAAVTGEAVADHSRAAVTGRARPAAVAASAGEAPAVAEPASNAVDGGPSTASVDTATVAVVTAGPGSQAQPPAAEPAAEALEAVVATPAQASVVASSSPSPAARQQPSRPAVSAAGEADPAPPLGSVDSDNDLLAERVAATAQWLRTARGSNFCIQLLLADVGRQDSLEGFLRRMQRLGTYDGIHVYETVIGARGWFGVLYGEFETFDEARAALESLPEELKRHKPFIRNVRDIVGPG